MESPKANLFNIRFLNLRATHESGQSYVQKSPHNWTTIHDSDSILDKRWIGISSSKESLNLDFVKVYKEWDTCNF